MTPLSLAEVRLCNATIVLNLRAKLKNPCSTKETSYSF